MKKRLHDKKAGIAILISLIVISLAEIIFRAVAVGEAVLTTANLGEQLAVVALAVIILILTAKGKDRACYICYGAWIGYFVFDQFFELPGDIITFIKNMSVVPVPSLGGVARIVVSICIIGLGVLLLEYMNDSTIFNKLFNTLSVIAVLFVLVSVATSVFSIATDMRYLAIDTVPVEQLKINVILDAFNSLYRGIMILLFTFFAYDGAKAQLKKTDLTK